MTVHKVTLLPSEKVIEIGEEESLLECLRSQGVYVKSSCGGHATCSDCLVVVTAGAENLNSPEFAETRLLGNVFHITKERLSCQTKVKGDVTVDISKHDEQNDEKRWLEKNKNTVLRKKGEPKPIKERPTSSVGYPARPKKTSADKRPKTFKYSKED